MRALHKKNSPADYHIMAKSRNAEWLGQEVPNARIKTRWGCLACGCEWEARYDSLQRGSACPRCSMERAASKRRHKSEAYKHIAKSRGLHWFGPEVANNATKTEWGCANGHRWWAPYAAISSGQGCPTCAGNQPKTESDYHAVATDRGFKWLGELPSAIGNNTLWECEYGHQWEASYRNIYHAASGCPYCANRIPFTETQYRELAKEVGIRWIGESLPSDTRSLTLWECSAEHQWQTSYDKIRGGTRCPRCQHMVNNVSTSAPQRQIAAMLDAEMNIFIEGFYVDVIYYDNFNVIAIEYDGYYWHRVAQDLTHDEKMRDEALLRAGYKVLRVRGSVAVPDYMTLHRGISSAINLGWAEIILEGWRL